MEYHNVMGVGTDGPEMLVSAENWSELSSCLAMIKLRSRFNSHRDIKLYGWRSNSKVSIDYLDDEKYVSNIVANATPIEW